VEIIFLEAEKDVLIRRFRETRRPHPLVSGDSRIEDAIDEENVMLLPLMKEADRIIDTSSHTPHQLRHVIAQLFRTSAPNASLTLNLISFGYKFGIPQNIDLLLDVRFIPNPYFIPALKERRGTDDDVRAFVLEQAQTKEFLGRAEALLDFLIPQYVFEGKAYSTIAFGCTGGRHRSPVIVEKMADHIRKRHAIEPVVVHRDME
ncbi:MAG TPA: RNase adapter RapZ, partial [Thermodesulfovibrionales bacterium]|nr:RNase adapter RapZ [Thermodesulfovibrionales bacterium]